MTIKEFITLNADIDVYDDVCEELGICFCGPMGLTEEGKAHFADVLEYDIDVDLNPCASAVVHIDGDGWKKRLRKAEEFFYSAAGYCADEDYQRWFVSPEWGNYATDPDANVYVCVYCDTTPWYTEDEMNKDNLCDLMFPRKLVQEFLEMYEDEPERIWDYICGGIGKYGGSSVSYRSRYIGEGERVEISKVKPQGKGYEPYC